jgi:hypothetical protein
VHIIDHALTVSYSTVQRQSAGRLVESKDTDSADAMIVRMSIDDRGYSMLHVELIQPLYILFLHLLPRLALQIPESVGAYSRH